MEDGQERVWGREPLRLLKRDGASGKTKTFLPVPFYTMLGKLRPKPQSSIEYCRLYFELTIYQEYTPKE